MLSEGKTSGVFQMESAGMTGVCVGLKPKDIEDITAIIALYRRVLWSRFPDSLPASRIQTLFAIKHPR
jgi:DNA polymerase-3 subunit alpha